MPSPFLLSYFLFNPHYEMIAEGCFNYIRDVSGFKRECRFLEGCRHYAAWEEAEVSTRTGRRATGIAGVRVRLITPPGGKTGAVKYY